MRIPVCTLVGLLGALSPLAAQQDSSLLTLDRIFTSSEFNPQFAGGIRWTSDGENYTRLVRADSGGQDLVRVNAATGTSTILIPASRFTPEGATGPLRIENYAWSPDGNWLLVFTNSARVWRTNTRGDFYVLPVREGAIKKLGGDAPASTLMFAKFSPDNRKVGYVRQNNLYVEDLATGAITQLTTDGSRTIINGTFDWVYEEEFGLRDGFRWSPDSRLIAYWQLDATGVRDFLLINDTDSLYSFVTPVQYPKAGTTNSAAKVGVVSVEGGPTRWMEVPGDSRNNYIARMDWAGNSSAIVLQHLNRLQNTDEVMLGDPATGAVRTVLTEQDSAWVDVVDDMRWLKSGDQFTWVSERSGWRQVYVVPREGGAMQLVTTGDFDVLSVLQIDERSGWVYYIASPENATQRYLYRSKLNGRGKPERLTPDSLPGWHSYALSPGARYALHTWSSFQVPPTAELIQLPTHKSVRVLVDNAELKARVATTLHPERRIRPR